VTFTHRLAVRADIPSLTALYGGNQTPGRDAKLLDPAVDAARVRAMYTSPAFARRGVGRLILSLCEAAASAEGFTRLELMSTLSGEPLYTAYGFRALERVEDATGGAPVPIIRMEKPVDPCALSRVSGGGGTSRTGR
jgi:GNAT superfamily N-acetyltransferase